MKKLHKTIALFSVIFITGVVVSVITVNSSFNKKENPMETVEIQKDTLYLLQAEKKTV
jgi:hypothetical protein